MNYYMDSSGIISAIRQVLGRDTGRIGLHEPLFAGNEKFYVDECLQSRWVSSVGSYVDKFEQMLAEYTGVKRAVAVVNGTSALHVCLVLTGAKQNDEVLIPALTFVATANAVSYCGAIPHFVESDEKTLGIDPVKLESYLSEISTFVDGKCINSKTGRCIKAVIPVHTFGHPVDLDRLVTVCKRFKLTLIEDAAESLGSFYKGRHTGNWGVMSALSFNGNKIITTGGGGAVLTNDENLGALAKHCTTTAKIPHRWEYMHDMIGYNYRLPNINAALGCAQLEQLPDFVLKKRTLAKKYAQAFKKVEGVTFFHEPTGAKSNYWLNILLLDEQQVNNRNILLEELNSAGLMSRPAWTLLHKLKMYERCPRMDLFIAESLERRLINIPSSASLIAS